MVVLFESDFEDAGLPEWDVATDYALVSDPKKCGDYSCRDNGWLYFTNNFGGTETLVYARFFVRFDGLTTDAGWGDFFYLYGGGSGKALRLNITYYNGANRLVLYMNGVGAQTAYGITELVSDKWYCIEAKMEYGANVTVQIYLDGSEECSLTGNTGTDTITEVELDSGGFASNYNYIYFDYLIIGTTRINCECDNGNGNGEYISIANAGGTLQYNATEVRERQACKVAVRGVPLRTVGSFVDTGTWTLKNRRLYMTIRLTDADKTTLQAIFDATAMVTIVMKTTAANYPRWTYTAWFVKKPLIYEYSVDVSGGNVNEWVAELEFVCSTFLYAVSA